MNLEKILTWNQTHCKSKNNKELNSQCFMVLPGTGKNLYEDSPDIFAGLNDFIRNM